MKPQLILLGAPGSGKGTQSSKLVSELGYRHISTGDLLRSEIAKGSDLGQRVKAIMDAGTLVDDATVLELLNANCDLTNSSYIFDGFPRNLEQAKSLDEVVLKGTESKAIYFEIDFEVLVSRIANRRLAPKSGRIYNLLSNPPKVAGKCDESGEDLIHRPDDNEDTVRTRINVFKETIGPVIDYYNEKGILKRIDASIDFEEVYLKLTEAIDA